MSGGPHPYTAPTKHFCNKTKLISLDAEALFYRYIGLFYI